MATRGSMRKQHHFHRWGAGDPAVPGHSHRRTGGEIDLYRGGPPDHFRQAAHQRGAAAVLRAAHGQRAAARGMKHHFEGFPRPCASDGDPFLDDQRGSCFYPELLDGDIMRRLRHPGGPAAFAGADDRGVCLSEVARAADHLSQADLQVHANFLHMMFSSPTRISRSSRRRSGRWTLIFLLHADHEQNCSTATVRMVASSQANLFASAAAGVCALWGPLHGGANQAVLEMLAEHPQVRRRRLEVHRGGQGQEQRQAADGLWASRLQELRSAGQDHQESLRRSA
jgi:hypothetical protein